MKNAPLQRKIVLGSLVLGLLVLVLLARLASSPVYVSAQTVPSEIEPSGNNSGQSQIPNAQTATDWSQVGKDPQRSGYSAEALGTNFNVAWTHPFQPEKVYPQVQAIVSGGKVFVGTEMGNLYALNATTGAQAWKFAAGGPILASVAVSGGKVFFGSMDGAVYALDANTGAQLWKSPVLWRHGFSTAPLVADNKVMLGARSGVFYALDPNDGHTIWQYTVGAPILQTPAWNGGHAYVGAMDMSMYAINTADGTLAWKSGKTPGMAFKDYWPVVASGRVVVRAMAMLPGQNNFYAFDETNGAQTITLPQFDGQTMNGATTPPCVESNGYLVVPVAKPNADFGSGWGRLNLANQQIVDVLVDASDPNAGFGNNDENLTPTCSSNLIFSMHTEEYNANYTGAFVLSSRHWIHIGAGQTNWGMTSNTQGGGGNPASISNGMFYHISYHELVARSTH